MQCNIDSKGKAVRLISGLICTLAGLVLLGLGWWGVEPFWVLIGVGVGTLAGGAFQIYEGWTGWCALRAMGWKTPM